MTIFNRLLNHRPYVGGLLNDMIRWPDNTDPNAWYYAEVQEATNSHEGEDVQVNGETREKWTILLQMRDWAALERAWSDAYDAPNPYKD